MTESIHSFRQKELRAIMRFIDNAYEEEIATILSEILVCHGLCIFDYDTKTRKKVGLIKTGGVKIELVTEEEVK